MDADDATDRESIAGSHKPDSRRHSSEGFSIGSVVFPVDKAIDFVDTESVLVNHVDSYVGKCIGQFLSEKGVGSTLIGRSGFIESDSEDEFDEEDENGEVRSNRNATKYWKVLGTFKDNKNPIPPWLWAVMKTENYEAYMKEILKCSVIIYDVTDDPNAERFDEIRAVCDALREKVGTFRTRRVFILISSVHTWSHSRPSDFTQNPDTFLTDNDYRRRRTKPLYRDLQLLERYVVSSGKMTQGMLKSYVIGAGAVYGIGESPFHHWFKSAWHNAKYLPIYGSGKNLIPTIYIRDLASIVQNVMDSTPEKQRYILAVDPVLCQQEQIVKAISSSLGTGKTMAFPEEDIYQNPELSGFKADQLLLDLKLETSFCKENFQIEFTADGGLAKMMPKIVAEYKKVRNLEPLKVCILGPPGVGKSTIAKQITDMYRLNHFTKEDMIKSTIEMLKDLAGINNNSGEQQTDPENLDNLVMDLQTDEATREEARSFLSEIEAAMNSQAAAEVTENEAEPNPESSEQPIKKTEDQLDNSILCRLYRYRLLTNQCQNQGFILDGFPETFEQARMLFSAGDGEIDGEEPGEDGKDALDHRLVPDRVLILEASDEFLTQRMLNIPPAQLQNRHTDKVFPGILADYREKLANYSNTFQNYLDVQEIIYFPIDVTTDGSHMMITTIGKIADMLGKPRNYGLTVEEEIALKNVRFAFEKHEPIIIEKEDLAQIESKELEERRNNIQKWMEKLAKIKREEFEREEAALIPLRHYLMAHVVPTLTKGLIEVTKTRPFDPVEFLAEFLFKNNPGSINSMSAKKYKEDIKN